MASIDNTNMLNAKNYALGIATPCGLAGLYAAGPIPGAVAFTAGGVVGLLISWSGFSQNQLEKLANDGKSAGREIKDQAFQIIKNTEKYLLASGISGGIYWLATRNLYSNCSQSSIPYVCNLPIVTDSILATATCIANTYLIIKATKRIGELVLSIPQKSTSPTNNGKSSSSKTESYCTRSEFHKKSMCAGTTCIWGGSAITLLFGTLVGPAVVGLGLGLMIGTEIDKAWKKC